MATVEAADNLRELNDKIPAAENAGQSSRSFFKEILADKFAFRRANGTVVDREEFLLALKSGGDRTVRDGLEILMLGTARAMVTCVVTVTVDGQNRDFDNARLFVRDSEKRWRLLAWANEPHADAAAP